MKQTTPLANGLDSERQSVERRGTMVYTEGDGAPGSAEFICECRTVEQAERFVKAVNSYDALVDALRTAQTVVFVAGGKQNTWKPELEIINAALKLAEGEGV